MRPMWSSGSFSSPRRATPRPRNPRAQLERGRPEHDALAVGVHGPPRRGRLGRGAHEQAAVLPHKAVVACAAREAGDHEPERLARLALLREGPLRGGGRGVERGHRLEGRPRVPGQGVLQEERGERVAREGDGVEHRVCLLVHAIVPFARFDETRLIKQKRIVHCSAPRLSAALRARYERAAYGKCQRRQSTPLKRVAASPSRGKPRTEPCATPVLLPRFCIVSLSTTCTQLPQALRTPTQPSSMAAAHPDGSTSLRSSPHRTMPLRSSPRRAMPLRVSPHCTTSLRVSLHRAMPLRVSPHCTTSLRVSLHRAMPLRVSPHCATSR